MLDRLKNLKQSVATRVASVKGSSGAQAPKHLVSLDIGTENIKALIGRIRPEDGGIDIIGMGRAKQELGDMQAGAIADIASVVQNCDQALNDAEQQAGVSVRSSVLGIAGELVKGTTASVRVTRKTPNKPLDSQEIEKIIALVQERAEEKAREQLKWELGGKDIEVKLINSALVGMEIDGYAVTNPVGFQGRDVLVQLYTAFAPLIHIGALERTAEQLDLDLVAVAAEPFGVARSMIGNNQTGSLNAIIIDVGGGTTDIAVVRDGGVQGTKMFGIGGRAFTRSIERNLNIDYEEAESLKIELSEGTLEDKRAPVVEKSVAKTLDVWMGGVELALAEFTKLDHLPHHIYLCGGGSSLQMLIDRMHTTDWYGNLPFARKPVVEHVRPEQVVGMTDVTGSVNDHTYITALGLLRVGLDTVQIAGVTGDSVKEKIDRVLNV